VTRRRPASTRRVPSGGADAVAGGARQACSPPGRGALRPRVRGLRPADCAAPGAADQRRRSTGARAGRRGARRGRCGRGCGRLEDSRQAWLTSNGPQIADGARRAMAELEARSLSREARRARRAPATRSITRSRCVAVRAARGAGGAHRPALKDVERLMREARAVLERRILSTRHDQEKAVAGCARPTPPCSAPPGAEGIREWRRWPTPPCRKSCAPRPRPWQHHRQRRDRAPLRDLQQAWKEGRGGARERADELWKRFKAAWMRVGPLQRALAQHGERRRQPAAQEPCVRRRALADSPSGSRPARS